MTASSGCRSEHAARRSGHRGSNGQPVSPGIDSAGGGGIIGLVDSTFGWYISSMIQHGRFQIDLSLTEMIATMLFVFLTAMFFGLLGGLISRWLNR